MTQELPPLPQAPAPPDVGTVVIGGGPPDWVGPVAVASLLIIVASVLLFPLVRAWARRLERGVVTDDVMDELVHLRERVAELEGQGQRMAELEERVDFTERLLTEARDAARLPRGGGA